MREHITFTPQLQAEVPKLHTKLCIKKHMAQIYDHIRVIEADMLYLFYMKYKQGTPEALPKIP